MHSIYIIFDYMLIIVYTSIGKFANKVLTHRHIMFWAIAPNEQDRKPINDTANDHIWSYSN